MTIGQNTILALSAALLATLGFFITARLTARMWVAILVNDVLLVLVLLVGPLIRLP